MASIFNASAQDAATPSAISSPSPVVRTVRISFVPPPIEGTISLGIFDSTGKLVRVLQREAEIEDFEIGHDALSATWDGKNDAGEPLPAGKYRARGYAVGSLEVDGIAYFFNDWVTGEDSPRIKRVENLALASDRQITLLFTSSNGEQTAIACDLKGNLLGPQRQTSHGFDYYDLVSPQHLGVRIENSQLSLQTSTGWEVVSWSNLVQPEAAALGKDGNVWVLDRTTSISPESALKEFSRNGDFLRVMTFPAADPQPKIVRGFPSEDKVFLLEENGAMQRVRGLTLVATKIDKIEITISDWKADFEKKIVAHKDFAIENGKPVVLAASGKILPEKVPIRLAPNPLANDARTTIQLSVGFDNEGSFLKTADGLPLLTISETRNLTRMVISARNEKSVDVFQDDGAVVEQFRVSGVDQMMAFDCGDFDLK